MHLATPAVLSIGPTAANVGPGKSIEISGGEGPEVGFAIYEDRPDRGGPGLVFVRIPDGSAAHAEPYHWSGFGSKLGSSPSTFSIPAGEYRIALLTTPGTALAITLRFSGLDGQSVTIASEAISFEALELESRVAGVAATPIHSQGASRTLPGRGLVIASFALDVPVHTATVQGYCFSEDLGLPAAPDEVAYLPGCPTVLGANSAGFVASSPGPYYQRLDVTAGPVIAGRYGIGYWYAGPSLIDATVPSVAGWLELG